jgi:multidrug efflux pump subunit AcrB
MTLNKKQKFLPMFHKTSGQSEQELETQKFLGTALIIALGIIFLILVLQFNSMSKPFIVITEIFFSIIGVLLGYAITGMTIHYHDGSGIGRGYCN